MEIYFVRHGETYLNRYGRMQGWSDSFLTENGILAVKKCAQSLAGIHFDKVYSSDSGRAIETAKIILAANESPKYLQIETSFFFRETCFGGFEGSISDETWDKVIKYFGYSSMKELGANESLRSVMNTMKSLDKYGDVESYEEFWKRVESGLNLIMAQNDEESKILVVCHGNYIRNIKDKYQQEFDTVSEIENSSVTKLLSIRDSFVIDNFT